MFYEVLDDHAEKVAKLTPYQKAYLSTGLLAGGIGAAGGALFQRDATLRGDEFSKMSPKEQKARIRRQRAIGALGGAARGLAFNHVMNNAVFSTANRNRDLAHIAGGAALYGLAGGYADHKRLDDAAQRALNPRREYESDAAYARRIKAQRVNHALGNASGALTLGLSGGRLRDATSMAARQSGYGGMRDVFNEPSSSRYRGGRSYGGGGYGGDRSGSGYKQNWETASKDFSEFSSDISDLQEQLKGARGDKAKAAALRVKLKKAYRRAAMKHHPDRGGDGEKFKKLKNAYESMDDFLEKNSMLLMSPSSRAFFNKLAYSKNTPRSATATGDSMFYEKLAAAKDAQSEDRGRFSALGALGGAAGATASSGAARALQNRGLQGLVGSVKDDPDELKRILKGMGATANSATDYTLTAKDGRKLKVDLAPGFAGNAYHDPTGRVFGPAGGSRGSIAMGAGMRDADTFFHELGHATGAGAKSKMRRLSMGATMAGKALTLGGLGSRLGGTAAAAYAGGAGNKEQADKANRISNALLLGNTLAEAPTLIEEARASIRANALSKKFTGKGISKGKLGKAYATYLGAALNNAAPALLAKGIAKYKQRKYRDEKTAAKEKSDRATGFARGYAGAIGGGALGATTGLQLAGRSPSVKDANDLLGYLQSNSRRIAVPTLVGTGLGAYAGYKYHKAQKRRDS